MSGFPGRVLFGFLLLVALPARAGEHLHLDVSQASNGSVQLKITNVGGYPLLIERGIAVEKVEEFTWKPIMAIEAVADCGAYDAEHHWHDAVRINPGVLLPVIAFHGASCGGQCPEACDSAYFLGQGTYRFVAITREGDRIPSPQWKLPGGP